MSSSTGLKRGANHLSNNSKPDNKKPKPNGSITSFFGPPKPKVNPGSTANGGSANTATAASGFKFNKDKWIASLTAEQKELLQLEIDTLHESWLSHLKDELVTKEFLNLKRFLQKELDSGVKVFPPLEDVYSWYAQALNIASFTFPCSQTFCAELLLTHLPI